MNTVNHENQPELVENATLLAAPDVAFDNDTAKKLASLIASQIPEVGGILSGLIDTFWPSDKVSVWDQIREQVEKLVNQKIADYNLERLKQTLQGVKTNVKLYKTLTDHTQKVAKLTAIENDIEKNLPWVLSGDPAANFSCFWGIALLHLSVRKELCEVVKGQNDAANEVLLRRYAVMYCEYGRVALSNIYNRTLNPVEVTAISENEAGKVSNWIIHASMVQPKLGQTLFEFHKRYTRKEWDENTLKERTTYCNQRISEEWDKFVADKEQKLVSWAYDAIKVLETRYTYTHSEVFGYLRDAMVEDDYNTFVQKYYPTESKYHRPVDVQPLERTRSKPDPVQLNPF